MDPVSATRRRARTRAGGALHGLGGVGSRDSLWKESRVLRGEQEFVTSFWFSDTARGIPRCEFRTLVRSCDSQSADWL